MQTADYIFRKHTYLKTKAQFHQGCIDAMIEFAQIACEEQKKICARDFQSQFFAPTQEERAVILQASLPPLK